MTDSGKSLRGSRRRLMVAGIVAFAAAALAAGLLVRSPTSNTAALAGPTAPAKREAAPELTAKPLVPPRVRLETLRGTPVVLNFWASWCVPCRKEAPELARFDRDVHQRAQLLGVDFQDSKADALRFVREFAWRFANVRDERGQLGARYGLIGLPTTFIIDARGRIAQRLTGPQTFARLVAAVAAVE